MIYYISNIFCRFAAKWQEPISANLVYIWPGQVHYKRKSFILARKYYGNSVIFSLARADISELRLYSGLARADISVAYIWLGQGQI